MEHTIKCSYQFTDYLDIVCTGISYSKYSRPMIRCGQW